MFCMFENSQHYNSDINVYNVTKCITLPCDCGAVKFKSQYMRNSFTRENSISFIIFLFNLKLNVVYCYKHILFLVIKQIEMGYAHKSH